MFVLLSLESYHVLFSKCKPTPTDDLGNKSNLT